MLLLVKMAVLKYNVHAENQGVSRNYQTLFFWAPKSMQMMTAAMELKDTYSLEKEMTTHSSILAWRIPGTAEPGGLLQSNVSAFEYAI